MTVITHYFQSSLQRRLTVILLSLITFPLVVVFFFANDRLTTVITQQANDNQFVTLAASENNLQTFFTQVNSDIIYLSNSPDVQSLGFALINNQDPSLFIQQNQIAFSALANVRGVYRSIRLLDASGQERVRVESAPNQLATVVTDTQLQNKSDRNYFIGASRTPADQTYVSALDLSREGTPQEIILDDAGKPIPALRYARALYAINSTTNEPQFAGIILLSLYADEFYPLLQHSTAADAYILNQDGYFLYNTADPTTTFGFEPEAETIGLKAGYKIEEIATDSTEALLIPTENLLSLAAPINNVSQHVYYTTFTPAGAPTDYHWTLITTIPDATLFAQVRNASIVLLLGILAIATFIILTTFSIIRQITRPIVTLRDTFDAFAAGNLSSRANIETIMRPDEIGGLGRSLNSMGEQLQNLLATLEQRVTNRTNDLSTAQEIAAAANQSRNIDDLINLAVNLIRDRFDFYYVQIYLISPDYQRAILKEGTGYVGHRLVASGHALPLDGISLVSTAVRTGRNVVVQDVTTNPNHLPNPLLPNTRAELVIPLIVNEKVIGVLDIQHTIINVFDEPSQNLFGTLTNQIAIALNNARSFDEMIRARADVQQAADRLGIVTSNYPNGAVFMFDSDLRFVLADGTALHQMGIPRETLIGRTALESFPEAMAEPLMDAAQRILEGEREVRGEMQQQGIIYETLTVSLYDQSDSIIGGLTIATDVTSRRQQEIIQQATFETATRRARELATVALVSAQASQILDMPTLLASVCDLVKEQFSLYHAHIYLLNENKDVLVLSGGAGKIGQQMLQRKHSIPLNRENSMVVRAALTCQSVIANDVTQAPAFLPNPLLPGTRSELSLPMLVGDELIGVFDFQAEEVNRFTDEDVLVQQTLTAEIAVAVKNARLFRDINTSNQQASILAQVASALSAAVEANDILRALALYSGTLAPHSAALDFINADTQGVPRTYISAALEVNGVMTPDDTIIGVSKPINQHPLAPVWLPLPNDILLVEDTTLDPRVDPQTRQALAERGYGAFALIPLRSAGTWQAIWTLVWEAPQVFSVDEETLFERLVAPLSAVVAGYRAALETRKRANELETVARVSSASAHALRLDDLLSNVVELTKTSFSLYHAHIYLLSADGSTLALAAGAGEPGKAMLARKHAIALDNSGSLVATAARMRLPQVVNNVEGTVNFLPNPMLPATRSEMAVPMIVGDEVIGVLDVQSEVLDRFMPTDELIMATLADQTGVAVRNAEAFERERRTIEQLREVDRLKQEFLANMSHELRTPLNSIIGFSEVLIDGVDGILTDEANEDVMAIYTSGKHLLNIINEILDLAKIEAGQMQLNLQPLNIDGVIAEAAMTAHGLTKEKPVSLVVEEVTPVGKIRGDRGRLNQVLLNLISNAIKFTDQGVVTLRYGMSGDHVRVEVQDTGIGMTPADLSVIFERFRQADGSSTRKAGGTGLGLTITRQLVTMHGGDIQVESTYGKGSTFWFTLPVIPESLPATAHTPLVPGD